jgi:hypothetical protein
MDQIGMVGGLLRVLYPPAFREWTGTP